MLRYALVLTTLLASPPAVSARTWHINPDGTGDAPTIQAGLDLTAVGDTVALSSGVYHPSTLRMADGVVLRGAGLGVTLDGQGVHQLLRAEDLTSPRTAIEQITFVRGIADSGGAIHCLNSHLVVQDCAFEGNYSRTIGGALAASPESSVQVRASRFHGNSASRLGGAISIVSPADQPSITSCEFQNNSANVGGAVFGLSEFGARVANSHFRENTSSEGGAVYFRGGPSGRVTIENCQFVANEASGGWGGAIGGEDLREGLFVWDCEFLDNSAELGGAVFTGYFTILNMRRALIARNQASALGGGVYTSGSRVVITQSTFVENRAPTAAALRATTLPGGIGNYSTLALARVIMALSQGGEALLVNGDNDPIIECTDIFGSEGGDWVGSIEAYGGQHGNLSVDPLFCDTPSVNYYLQWGSPCLAQNSPDSCIRIGCYDAGGCNSISVEPESWTRVKARYR